MRGSATCLLLIISFLLLTILLRYIVSDRSRCLAVQADLPVTFTVILTTIPPRLYNPWVWNNLASIASMPGVKRVRVYVPHALASNPQLELEVPADLFTSPRVEIRRCLDEGPLTKLVAALQDPEVPDDEPLCVVDDDVVFISCAFAHLSLSLGEAETNSKKNAVHTFCSQDICGYQGYAARKYTLLRVLEVARPVSCFYVDDDFVREALIRQGIERIAVPLHTEAPWCSMRVLPTVLGPQYLDGAGLIWKLSRHKNSQRDCNAAMRLKDLTAGSRAEERIVKF